MNYDFMETHTYDLCKTIQTRIIDDFQASYDRFLGYILEEKNPNIIKFVKKYIDWYENNDLYNFIMFEKVINQDSNYIWDNLRSFCINYFYDDSLFSVNWYKSELSSESSDGTKKVPADKENMHSFPVVEWDDDYGRHDVNIILEAMEQYEKNEKTLMQYYKDLGFE